MQASETEPNGGIVAATVAAGAGCAALGLLTVGAATSGDSPTCSTCTPLGPPHRQGHGLDHLPDRLDQPPLPPPGPRAQPLPGLPA